MSISLVRIPLIYPATMQSPYTWEASGALRVTGPTNAFRLIATLTGSPPPGIVASIVNVLDTRHATLLLTGVPTGSGSNVWGVIVSDPVTGDSDTISPISTSVLPPPTIAPVSMTLPLAIHTFGFNRWYLSYRIGGVPGSGVWNLAGTIYDGTGAFTCSGGALTADLTNNKGLVGTLNGPISKIGFIGNGFPDSVQAISVTGVDPFDLSIEDYWDISEGAWWYDGASGGAVGYYLLVKVLVSGDSRLGMLYSPDGTSPWTEMDRAHAPIKPDTVGAHYAVRRDLNTRTKVFVFSQIVEFNNTMGIFEFNFSSGQWVAPTITIDLGTLPQLLPGNGLIAFPGGDFGIFYGFTGGAFYRFYSAMSGWGSQVTVASGAGVAPGNIQYDPLLDELYLFYYLVGGAQDGRVQRFQRDGTPIGTVGVFDADTVDGFGHGMIYSDDLNGDNVYAPWDSDTDKANAVWVAPRGTVDFRKELLPIPEGEEGNFPSCAYMQFGQFLVAPPNVAESLSLGIGFAVDFTPPFSASLSLGLGLHVGLGQPNLKLVKVVSNTHGGTAVPSDFTLNAAGPTPITGHGIVGPTPVKPGTYVLTESGPTGYTASQWTCTGATVVNGVVTITAGETVVCTIHNSDTGGGGGHAPTPPTPNPPPCPDDPIAPPTFHAIPEGVTSTPQIDTLALIFSAQEPEEPTIN